MQSDGFKGLKLRGANRRELRGRVDPNRDGHSNQGGNRGAFHSPKVKSAGINRAPFVESLQTPYSLLERLAERGPEWNGAWNEFFSLYAGWIRSIALRRELRSHEIGDVLQETMTELFRVLPLGRYRPEQGKFRGFLTGVVRLNIQRALQRRQRAERGMEPLPEPIGEAGREELVASLAAPDEAFERCARLALVEQALRALVTHGWMTQQRVDIFVALTAEHLPPVEVAARFGTSRNNVDAAKHAVKTKLQLMIQCLEEGIDPREGRE